MKTLLVRTLEGWRDWLAKHHASEAEGSPMSRSLAAKIEAANSSLITNGNSGAIGEFFTPDYVVHLTDEVMKGGHDTVRRILETYRRAFPDLQVEVEILVKARDRVAWQRTLVIEAWRTSCPRLPVWESAKSSRRASRTPSPRSDSGENGPTRRSGTLSRGPRAAAGTRSIASKRTLEGDPHADEPVPELQGRLRSGIPVL